MEKELIDKVNNFIDEEIEKKSFVATKELVSKVYRQLSNQGQKEDLNKIVRSRLSWLNKERVILRMITGKYDTNPFVFKTQEDYFSQKRIDKIEELFSLLDYLYGDNWSPTKNLLELKLNLTESFGVEDINILLTSKTSINKTLIEYANSLKVNINYVKLKGKKDIFLYSLVEMFTTNVFDESKFYVIEKILKKNNLTKNDFYKMATSGQIVIDNNDKNHDLMIEDFNDNLSRFKKFDFVTYLSEG